MNENRSPVWYENIPGEFHLSVLVLPSGRRLRRVVVGASGWEIRPGVSSNRVVALAVVDGFGTWKWRVASCNDGGAAVATGFETGAGAAMLAAGARARLTWGDP